MKPPNLAKIEGGGGGFQPPLALLFVKNRPALIGLRFWLGLGNFILDGIPLQVIIFSWVKYFGNPNFGFGWA